MTLAPKLPPGRANRKALQFAADIHRLRNAGYTFSAIRVALLEAGLSVGLSTIKREAARKGVATLPAQHFSGTHRPSPMAAMGAASPGGTAPPLPLRPGATALPGKAIAEEFMRGRPTNTLFLTESSK